MKKLLIYLFLFLIFTPGRIFAQVDASFTVQVSPLASFLVRCQGMYQPSDTLDYEFLWDFGDGSSSASPNPDHLYESAGTYTIGFRVTHRSTLATDFSSMELTISNQLALANVFTPNGDGVNDYFMIPSNGYEEFTIYIFNRWGNLVYRVTSTTIVWDGRTADGTLLGPGYYFYILRSVNRENPVEKTGFIRLFR